jgi:hypothetical protein
METMINKESLYEKTSATENDWRYSDERMELRAECFRALKFYLNDYCRYVYEFCDMWVSQGNKDCTNIDSQFRMYLSTSLERLVDD